MKALVKEAPEHGLSYLDIPQPEIANPDDVLFKVEYCAIGLDDAKIYIWSTWAAKDEQLKLPAILGHEASGTIVAAGEAVQGLSPGDHITIESFIHCGECFQCRSGRTNLCSHPEIFGKQRGAFAEYAVIPARAVHRLPPAINLKEATLLDNLGLAVHVVEMARSRPGDWAVIFGATPVGILTTQVLQASGVSVVVADVVDARLEVAQKITGAHIVNGRADDVRRLLGDLADGRRADIAIVNLAVQMMLEQAFDVVRDGATIVTLGAFTRPVELDLYHHITAREIALVGATGRTEETWRKTMQLVESGTVKLEPLIAMTLPMDDYFTAFEFTRAAGVIKVLLQPGAQSQAEQGEQGGTG